MVKPKEYSSEQLAGLEWDMDKFLEDQEQVTIAPRESLTYKGIHGRTSLKFINYDTIPPPSEENEEEQTHQEMVHIELINEENDKIIFPKELGIILNKKELLELEEQMYLNNQIKEKECLYYDSEQNMKIGIIEEDYNDNKSDISHDKNLMDDTSVYRTFDDETPFDRTERLGPITYGDGFPPRAAYNEYQDPPENKKYIARR